jgi:hypothetical protein
MSIIVKPFCSHKIQVLPPSLRLRLGEGKDLPRDSVPRRGFYWTNQSPATSFRSALWFPPVGASLSPVGASLHTRLAWSRHSHARGSGTQTVEVGRQRPGENARMGCACSRAWVSKWLSSLPRARNNGGLLAQGKDRVPPWKAVSKRAINVCRHDLHVDTFDSIYRKYMQHFYL